MQTVAISKLNDLLEDGNHDRPEVHECFRRAQTHQAVRIA